MSLPRPDCPQCHRMTEDRVAVFLCPSHCDVELPIPEAWYRDQAALFGGNVLALLPAEMWLADLGRYAYNEARWAARAAMRACPELRG